jgi:preprotein translocase subunit SecA
MFDTFSNLAKKIFGDANDRELKKLQPNVDRINSLEAAFEQLTDEQVAAKTIEFKQRLENGEPLDNMLCEAFAAVREASKRTLGMRPYNCQLVGGMVLHSGRIAEMKTGEGKTLSATLPLYLNGLEGKGAHLVTVNDYLASRDADWMEPVYNFLGMKVGKILSKERNHRVKQEAYGSDITYGTNNEFGFDYLRDNMKFTLEEYTQRGSRFGIVDEVDSILIDEARTPLIISGPMDADVNLYSTIDAVVPSLQNEVHFVVDEKGRSVSLTDEGVSRIEERLGIDNLYDPHNMEILHHLMQSLKAHYIFKRDRDYVVRGGEVVIVDEFTGRLMPGRRWSDGLHQGVEAKEKVRVQQESQTYATITFQNYFRMYDKLAGMTGTAATEAAEFASIYDLDTVVIPTNRPITRLDHEDIVYKTQMEKYRAVVETIEVAHSKGQPVLVGTTSVEKSEIVAKLLERKGIRHEILNAKQHEREAHIVAQAGRKGSVTISTNMAGRGTDIKLGGNPEEMAAVEVDPEAEPEKFENLLAIYLDQCAKEKEEVLAAGGLFIVGTERHESRRIDNQLRGRSGRQGDPGASRFYLSLEDDLLRIFSSDKITVWMERMGLQDDEPIEHRWISRAIENAQRKVEGIHFNSRKNLLEYDDVMNYQRKGVYEVRRRALGGEGISDMVRESIDSVIDDVMDDFLTEGLHPEHWNIDGMRKNINSVFSLTWDESDEEIRDWSREEIQLRIRDQARERMDGKSEEASLEAFEQHARMLILHHTDTLWKHHLLAIDRLRQGVGLRGYGQRNPLLEYKREAFQMFLMMAAARDEKVLENLYQAPPEMMQVASQAPGKSMARRVAEGAPAPAAQNAAPALAIPNLPQQVSLPKAPPKLPAKGTAAYAFGMENHISRNSPCPCGSQVKFKKCCYKAGPPEGWSMPVVEEAEPETEDQPPV